MARKRKSSARIPKKGPVFHMSSEEATLAKMPKYNGYAVGHGPHGSKGYDRGAEKRKTRRMLEDGE